MSVAADGSQAGGLRQRLARFVQHVSTEITSHDDDVVPSLAATLPPGTTVYVAHTPKSSLDDVVRVALEVQAAGLRASPHLVARRIASAAELDRAASSLRGAGVEQVLVIAGDSAQPAGPYACSLQLLESGVLTQARIRRVAVAGHPEGHPAVGEADLWSALRAKQAWAERAGVSMHIVTQFGFDPEAICTWAGSLESRGIRLQVHAGMAGPTPLPRLIRYAMACGVGASVRGAMRNFKAMSGLAGLATSAEDMLVGLASGRETVASARIVQPHVFAFGGSVATARWLRALLDGSYELRDGKLTVRAG